ncbi:MAG: crossover junction endodeoxyribonuclease RuvC [Patescibacteria group bacterium]
MIILGIDPGFDRLGYAVLSKEKRGLKLIHSDCLLSEKKLPYEKRLFFLAEKVGRIITKYHPDILAIEKIFFTKNQKTALRISEMRGAILYLASSYNLCVLELTPLQVKIAITGYGRAEKSQIQKMIGNELKIKNKPKYDDETDAIAIGLTASFYLSTIKN